MMMMMMTNSHVPQKPLEIVSILLSKTSGSQACAVNLTNVCIINITQ